MDGPNFTFKPDQDNKVAGKSIFGSSRLQRKENAAAPARGTEGFKLGFSFSGRQTESSAENNQETKSSSGFAERLKPSNRDALPSLFRPSIFARTENAFGGVMQSRDSMKLKKSNDERARSNSPSRSTRHHLDRERDAVNLPGASLAKDKDATKPFASISMNHDQKSVMNDLMSLRGKQCSSEYDKYMILEERDKLLYKFRSASEKTGGVPFKPNTGFCTAMCTEKERYVREVQKRISSLECFTDGTVDCSKLVKEYARSAADQEKPLPHELRGAETLQSSMVYLLTQILDGMPISAEDLAVWYDFLWSRTRAIRKEITQLMLTDERAVQLVERCTRLHILCSYALCGLEVEKFDQNMNTENLAKCLQTLRHLYDDLEHKGINCTSEAEFRAYDVMLHLHDSNVLRQVLSYRKEVRESRQVRLAIQLACCLQSHNYVRFFRLLKNDASFLQSCICHRFFNMVRSSALSTLVKSSGRNSPYLLSKLSKTLAFDDSTTALETLETLGIFRDEGSDDMVIMSKDTFTSDITAPWNTYKWIDIKSEKRRSQIVFGSDILPPLAYSVISSSFDDNDVYRNDPIMEAYLKGFGSQQASSGISSTIASSAPSFVPPPIPRPVVPVVQTPVFDSAKKELVQRLCDEIIAQTSDAVIRSAILKGTINAHKVASEEREIQRKKQREEVNSLVQRLTSTLVSNAVENLVEHSFCTEKRACFNTFVDERVTCTEKYVWDKVILPYCDERIERIVKKSVKLEKEMFDKQLMNIRKRLHVLWLKQFWDVWRAKVMAIKKGKQRRSAQWSEFNYTESSSFKPESYLPGRKNHCATLSVNTSLISMELKLIQWRMKRRVRIARSSFQKWRDVIHRRVYNRKLLDAMSSTFYPNGLKDITIRFGQKRRYDIDDKQKPLKHFRLSLNEEPTFSFADPNRTDIHHMVTPNRLNSTAMTWHSNVNPGCYHSMSAIDFSTIATSPVKAEDNLDTSIRDIEYVRRVCGQLDPVQIPIAQKTARNSTVTDHSFKIQPQTDISEQIVKGIETTRNATENLETKVLDLEKRMMNHSSLLAHLFNKFQTKSVERT